MQQPTRMNQPIVYHERVQLPLYRFKYDIFIADNMGEAITHINQMFPNLNFDIVRNLRMYTCTIRHPEHGAVVMIILNKKEIETERDAKNAILRGSVNLSWHILDELDVKLGPDDYETQGYTVEEVNRKVLAVFYKNHDFNANIGTL